MNKKILVVGSNGHSLAKKCVDWGDQFYVGDFDFVFFNLASLSQEILNSIVETSPHYFQSIRKHIVEIQLEKGLPIWCIMNDLIFSSRVGKGGQMADYLKWCNYGWSPVVPILEGAAGEGMKRETSSLPAEYLRLLQGWNGYYENVLNNTDYENRPKDYIYFRTRTNSLLANAADKDISFSILWLFVRDYKDSGFTSTAFSSKSEVFFLPEPSNIKAGIDVILKEYALDESNEAQPPSWISDIKIIGEEKLELGIKENKSKLLPIRSLISSESQALEDLRKYKQLLYCNGLNLEKIVEESLRLVGIELQKAEVEGKEDRVFVEDDVTIPVEIRGKDNSALTEDDIRQVISRLGDKGENPKYKTRGIFILNHYRLTTPSERVIAFHSNIVKDQAMPWDICLISTNTIFQMVEDKLNGEDLSDIKDKILNTSGVFEYKPRRADIATIAEETNQ